MVEAVADSVASTGPLFSGHDQTSHDGLVDAIAAGDPELAAREAGEFLDWMIDSIE